MSFFNNNQNTQTAVNQNNIASEPAKSNVIPITVRTNDSNSSMPAGGLKPLNEERKTINIDAALTDDTPGTADFSSANQQQSTPDFSQLDVDTGIDFIETPVDKLSETEQGSSEGEKPAEKAINIVDKTPEAENLIDETPTMDAPTMDTSAPKTPVDLAPESTPLEAPAETPSLPKQPEAPAETPKETELHKAPKLDIDAEHAFDDANEDLFHTTREKITNLRKERNELIASVDEKEDELTALERLNSQYEIAGEYEKISYSDIDKLRNEIRDIRTQAETKERALRSALKLIRAM
jgi:hypothetical protein